MHEINAQGDVGLITFPASVQAEPAVLQAVKHIYIHTCLAWALFTLETVCSVFKMSCTGGFSGGVSQNTGTALRIVPTLGTFPMFWLMQESLKRERLLRHIPLSPLLNLSEAQGKLVITLLGFESGIWPPSGTGTRTPATTFPRWGCSAASRKQAMAQSRLHDTNTPF